MEKGLDVSDLVSQVKKDHIVDIAIQKAYRVRKLSESLIEELYKEIYNALRDYVDKINVINLKFIVKFKNELGA